MGSRSTTTTATAAPLFSCPKVKNYSYKLPSNELELGQRSFSSQKIEPFFPSKTTDCPKINFLKKLSLAEFYFQAKQFEEAEKLLDRLSKSREFQTLEKKTKTKIFLKKAKIYELKKDYTKALRNYNKALLNQKEKQEIKSSLLSSAKVLLKQGALIQADRIFKSLVSLEPLDTELLYQYAQVKEQQKRYFEAIDLYKKVLSLESSYQKDSLFLKRYAESFSKTGSWATAGIVWQNYLKLEPEDRGAWLTLAKVQTRQNERKAALNSYQKALKLGAEEKSILEKLLWIYEQLESWKSLENASKKLIEQTAPKNASYYLLYAKALVKQSREKEAIKFLLKSQEEINSLDFYLKLGKFILGQQNYYLASSIYQKALSLYPQNLTAILGLANSYKAIGLFEKARELYQIYLKKIPYNYKTRKDLAESLYYSGQEKAAINEYQKIIKSKPKFSEAYYELGSIFINTNLEKSKKLWQKHLQLEKNSKYKYQIYYYFPELK